jgi:hypothetical protein
LDLHRLDVQVTAPFALTGVGGSSLRDSHDFHFPQKTGIKHAIVGQSLAADKPGPSATG